MAVRDRGIDVVLDADVKFVPQCEHGPTLLFSKYDTKTNSERQFFACSAFRDKKVCSFFKWAEDVKQCNKDSKSNKHNITDRTSIYNHKGMRERYSRFKKLPQTERCLCIECGLLLLPGNVKDHEGDGHTLKCNITDIMLSKPTELFKPLEDNKTYAQYLFSKKTVDFLIDMLQNLDVTHVLCMGCPRIHEAVQLLQVEEKFHMQSLLLDLDHRYLQTFAPGEFCRYNMLNDHFFGGDSERVTFQHFVSSGGKVAMVTDPPFGVMVDAFYKTISKVQKCCKGTEDTDEMPVFWFFPYFMERRVNGACPKYQMLDYKVDYDNHALFSGDKGRKKGSPVRIFTNVLPKLVQLPKEDGYRYCELCEKYSSKENIHCNKCNCCPTKDGYTYIHCDACERCVKPSRTHCYQCKVCDVPGHQCGKSVQQGCYICGETDHKRRECPSKSQSSISSSTSSKKRKQGSKSLQKKKKKK